MSRILIKSGVVASFAALWVFSVWVTAGLLMDSRVAPVEDVGGAEVALETATGGYEEAMQPDRLRFPIADEDFLRFTSPFGVRVSPFTGDRVRHMGLDIATVWRAQVVTAESGVVVEHWPPPGTPLPSGRGTYRGHPVYGGMLRIDHGDGVETLYAHLSQTWVRQGQVVRSGEVIANVGATGMAAGEHLHFEVVVNGGRVNPLLWVADPTESW